MKKNSLKKMKVVNPIADQRRQEELKRATIIGLQAVAILTFPELANAAVEDTVDWIADLLTGRIARGAAIIAVAALGYMAWAGQMSWKWALNIVAGIFLVFGGAAFVDEISGAAV